MKTQVIQLDVHDNLISIRDRMGWVKTPRILLVWPKHGQMEVRPLDLTLLRRHAGDLGAELGLVTRNGEMREAARELHISVFSSTGEAQKKQWLERLPARPQRRFPQVDLRARRDELPRDNPLNMSAHPLRRVLIFATGVLAVLLVMLVLVPSAEIKLNLPEQKQSLTITVSSDPETREVQISGIVPARQRTLTVEGSDSALASGSRIQPGQFATGVLVLKNLTTRAVSVPAGTLFLSLAEPPVSFVSTQKAEVPAGKGLSTNVPVRASQAGLSGNTNPGALRPAEAALAANLTANNPAPISGGTQTILRVATSEDRDSLKRRLLAELQRKALESFTSQAAAGDVLFPATLAQARVLAESFDPAEGESAEKLKLSLQVEYSMSYASEADLQSLAERALDAAMPAGYVSAAGPVTHEPVSGLTQGQSVMRWQMRIERPVQPLLDPGKVITSVQGKTVTRAGSILGETFKLSEPAQISVHPGWWPWLPFLPIRIAVKG
ncbi:MAG TPA: baseplate J/gp47 family protein [Anaerolineales bacterium]|jgi:hypothetical protein